jgi:hypothetical protein
MKSVSLTMDRLLAGLDLEHLERKLGWRLNPAY